MVIISGAMGFVLQKLIQGSTTIEEILYCSNVAAMNPQNIPYFNTSDPNLPFITNVPGSTQSFVKALNFLIIAAALASGPSAGGFGSSYPCVRWFGRQYPQSPIYERPPNATSAFATKDSLYSSEPLGGWLGVLSQPNNPIENAKTFQDQQLRPWFLYTRSDKVPAALLGTLEEKPLIGIADALAFFNTSLNTTFTPANSTNGIFNTIEPRYWAETSSGIGGKVEIKGFQAVPFFKELTTKSDNAIASILQSTIDKIARSDTSVLLKSKPSAAELFKYFSDISKIINDVPFGATDFEEIDFVAKKFAFTHQIGSDKRIAAASSFPKPGIRQLLQQSQLNNAILRFSNTSSPSLASSTITQGTRAFPQLANTAIEFPAGGLIGRILFPFGVSFLLPIFVVTLVKEKEDRILVMMKMNGLNSFAYFVSHYVTFYILFVISTFFFLVSGFLIKLQLFTQTDLGLLILLFFVWGLAQNALVFLFASIFSKSRNALVLVFMIVLGGVIISLVTGQLFVKGEIPYAYFLWPPFAFYRALQSINEASYLKTLRPYKMNQLVPGDEVFTAIMFLWVESFAILLLAFYISAVLPSEFGVPRPWHFPLTDIKAYITKSRNKIVRPVSMDTVVEEAIMKLEDEDVKAERQRVDAHEYEKDCPLVMSHMRKVYPSRSGLGPKLAVRDITLAVEEGVVFGLLGPNGAGKTTLISMLTGLYRQTSGQATLAGFDISTETNSVYENIGICPQFDILWDDLTVGEHLFFYARLKGVPVADERKVVTDSLQIVSLLPFENRLTKGLSGGEKRRLSIAIALVGNPSVVFLDEPTTGLDPEIRRLIWTIINDAREGKTIVLTTHSMEEAEALCQRIGIMAKGALRCIGNALRLKEQYGSGFKLFFNSHAEDTARACSYIETLLPAGWKKMDAFTTNTSYEFPAADGVIAALFKKVEVNKSEYGIIDWGVSQTTLEEVFLRIISDSDAQAD